jgi:hypothetical protein
VLAGACGAVIESTKTKPVLETVSEYRLKYIRDFQVTALLVVDGKLQLRRKWLAQDEQFAD